MTNDVTQLESRWAAARHFILLCREAGIARDARNYLWAGFREEGFALVVDGGHYASQPAG